MKTMCPSQSQKSDKPVPAHEPPFMFDMSELALLGHRACADYKPVKR